MSETELIQENEHLRIENAKLRDEIKSTSEQVRNIQSEISKANCMAMALVNVLAGTSR